ncbi:MAG TPA: AmmeMemoRadiSam system protein A [Geopsychrobacteraceae bacterium]
MAATFSAEDSATLLRIAGRAILCRVSEEHYECELPTGEALNACRGCFVTITQNGRLRGCIGNFTTDRPLYREVAEMAVSAATRDPRFHPLQPEELDNFSLSISVLSPLQKITDIEEISIGTHGIYLEKGFQRGVLLPQVATEYGWGRKTFLRQTCRKAGLAADAWQASDTDLYIFSATILQES